MTVQYALVCDICGGPLRPVLTLGSSPPTCAMVPADHHFRPPEEHYPLDLLYCDDCSLGQLSVVVDPEVSFAPDYPYSSGNSRQLHDNFGDLAHQASVWGKLTPADLVVDIGANDGTLLRKFHCRTVGVEPTRQSERITGAVVQEFFTAEVAQAIRDQHGKAKVITACNVLAHVDDIGEVMAGVNILLADDGVFVGECGDLTTLAQGQWDTVYHEHLRFYSPHAFWNLLTTHGLCPRTWDYVPTHGGSFRMLATREGLPCLPPEVVDYDWEALAGEVRHARRRLRRELAADHQRTWWGVGATARATTIINYCGLDVEDIECVAEVAGSDKIGHCIPGTRIPVVDEAHLFEDRPDGVVLFSWHLADIIVPALRERGYGGAVLLPLSTPAPA